MTELHITPAQRRAALEALGLDPDHTLSVALSPEWVNARTVDTHEGVPRVVDGQLAVVELSGPIRDPEPEVGTPDGEAGP